MSTPRVGVVGRDVPIEAIEAHGAAVHRWELHAVPITAEAEEILGRGVDPAVTAVLSAILSGTPDDMVGIVLCSDCDATQRLFYALRELARVEPERGLPPVHLVDILHVPRAASLAYSHDETVRLAQRLQEWTGTTATPETWASAVRGRDEVRRGLSLVSDRRPEGTGTDFFALRAACDELSVEAALARVQKVLDAPLPRDERVPVALTGSAHYDWSVIAKIERCGVVVVADDCPGGQLGLQIDTREPTNAGLAERYLRDGLSPHRGSATERAAALAAAARCSGARAVISYARRRDDAAAWDRAALDPGARGAATDLPLIVLRDQEFGELDDVRLRAELARIGVDDA
jgi:benzoyl-CoA reductase/2-hydroxyglutaryl-CoA dehydratase subunit BcrC/BadD/HgdB